ncbi:hypothetical protein B5P43_10400 [Bacillus sp. SRB_336]|nr:hypothetical protein B5P43_10400 [Bacillus sp. SRB_336]
MKANQQDQPQATGTTSSFTTRFNPDAEGTHFSTTAAKANPKPAGKALLAGATGFVAILIIGVTTSAKGEASIFTMLMAVVFGVGLTCILHRFRLNDERVAAADTHFFAGRYAVSTVYPQDAKVAPDAIDVLRIRNTMTGATVVLREYIGTPSIGSAVALAGNGVRNQLEQSEATYLQHLADNSFVVEVQSNGKTAILAGGLDEVTATGLMNAVSRAVAQQ